MYEGFVRLDEFLPPLPADVDDAKDAKNTNYLCHVCAVLGR